MTTASVVPGTERLKPHPGFEPRLPLTRDEHVVFVNPGRTQVSLA